MTDKFLIACNYTDATNVASVGALAYIALTNPGNGNDRISILVRSRGGRWVVKYEDIRRLDNFRIKTIPPEHPRYEDPDLSFGFYIAQFEMEKFGREEAGKRWQDTADYWRQQ